MRILYVGFKGKNNTSFQLVSALGGEHLFLTNSFAGVAQDIEAIKSAYDLVILFGLDKNLSGSVRIENRAELQGNTRSTKCDADQIAEVFGRNEVRCEISERLSHYLCNHAYYRILQKTNGNAILIHIPGNRYMTDDLMEGIVRSVGGLPCPSFQNR